MHAANKCSISCPLSSCQHYLPSARGISGPWHPPPQEPRALSFPSKHWLCLCCVTAAFPCRTSPLLSQVVRSVVTSCGLHWQLSNLGKLESSASISHFPRKNTLSCADQNSAELLMAKPLSLVLPLLAEIAITDCSCCFSIVPEYLMRHCLFEIHTFVSNALNWLRRAKGKGLSAAQAEFHCWLGFFTGYIRPNFPSLSVCSWDRHRHCQPWKSKLWPDKPSASWLGDLCDLAVVSTSGCYMHQQKEAAL